MNKKLIRLTESDLHRIVKESVQRIISEMDEGKNVNNKEFFNNWDNSGKAKKGEFTWGLTNKDKSPLDLQKHNERTKAFRIDNDDDFPGKPRDPLAARERQLKSGDIYGMDTLRGKLDRKHKDDSIWKGLQMYGY